MKKSIHIKQKNKKAYIDPKKPSKQGNDANPHRNEEIREKIRI